MQQGHKRTLVLRFYQIILIIVFLLFLYFIFKFVQVKPIQERVAPEPNPVTKIISLYDLNNRVDWLPSTDSELVFQEIEKYKNLELRVSYYHMPTRDRTIVVEALDIRQKSNEKWLYVDTLFQADWSDFSIDAFPGSPYKDIKRAIFFNSNEILFINEIRGSVYLTQDAGQTWQVWMPSENWQVWSGDPSLQEYDISPNGEGKLVYYNVSINSKNTKRYTFFTKDKGLTWKLGEVVDLPVSKIE